MKIRKIISLLVVATMLFSIASCTTTKVPKDSDSTDESSAEEIESDVSEETTNETSVETEYTRPVFDSPVVQRIEQMLTDHGYVFMPYEGMYDEGHTVEEAVANIERLENGVCGTTDDYVEERIHSNCSHMNAYKIDYSNSSFLVIYAWTFETEEEALSAYESHVNSILSDLNLLSPVEDILGEVEYEDCHIWITDIYNHVDRDYIMCYTGQGVYIEGNTVVEFRSGITTPDNTVMDIYYDLIDALGCRNPVDFADLDYSLVEIREVNPYENFEDTAG